MPDGDRIGGGRREGARLGPTEAGPEVGGSDQGGAEGTPLGAGPVGREGIRAGRVVPVQAVGRGDGRRNRAIVVALFVAAGSIVGVAALGARSAVVDRPSPSIAHRTAQEVRPGPRSSPALGPAPRLRGLTPSPARGVPSWVRGPQVRSPLGIEPARNLATRPTVGEDGLIGGIAFRTSAPRPTVGAGDPPDPVEARPRDAGVGRR
jgi:hypothetical protein